MTTKNEQAAAQAPETTTAMTQHVPGGTLAHIPKDLQRDAGRGTENIGAGDVRPPRVKICQSGSPERKEGNEKQIAGLQELDLFNNLSQEIYGRKLTFQVIAVLPPKGMQFNADMSVADFDVAMNDPRMQFTTDTEGKRVKPVASKFYNFLCWLPETSEVVVMSWSSTLIATAVKLMGMLKLPLKLDGSILPNPPAWARTYEIETKMKNDAKYSWGILNLKQVGVTPPDVREIISTLAASFEGRTVAIDYDAADAADPNDPNTIDTTGRTEPDDM
jgi:hypothetical protein